MRAHFFFGPRHPRGRGREKGESENGCCCGATDEKAERVGRETGRESGTKKKKKSNAKVFSTSAFIFFRRFFGKLRRSFFDFLCCRSTPRHFILLTRMRLSSSYGDLSSGAGEQASGREDRHRGRKRRPQRSRMEDETLPFVEPPPQAASPTHHPRNRKGTFSTCRAWFGGQLRRDHPRAGDGFVRRLMSIFSTVKPLARLF